MTLSMSLSAVSEYDDARIDTSRLRLAREDRGLSVSEAARWITLSRAQVEQIEGGGFSAFYSPAHKALAVRKYASAFGLDPEVVLGLAPEPVEPAGEQAAAPLSPESTAPSVATVAAPDTAADRSEPVAAATLVSGRAPLSVGARKSVQSLMLALLVLCVMGIAFAIVRGWVDRFAEPTMSMAAPPIDAPLPPVDSAPEPRADAAAQLAATADAAAQLAATADAAAASSGPDCAAGRDTDTIPEWMPAYVRKPDTRLYISGPAGSEVCVADSSGTISRLVLTAGTMQSVDGRPPYLVQSASLDALQMFLQGLKVKVPNQSASIRLLPGERSPLRDASAVESSPAS